MVRELWARLHDEQGNTLLPTPPAAVHAPRIISTRPAILLSSQVSGYGLGCFPVARSCPVLSPLPLAAPALGDDPETQGSLQGSAIHVRPLTTALLLLPSQTSQSSPVQSQGRTVIPPWHENLDIHVRLRNASLDLHTVLAHSRLVAAGARRTCIYRPVVTAVEESSSVRYVPRPPAAVVLSWIVWRRLKCAYCVCPPDEPQHCRHSNAIPLLQASSHRMKTSWHSKHRLVLTAGVWFDSLPSGSARRCHGRR